MLCSELNILDGGKGFYCPGAYSGIKPSPSNLFAWLTATFPISGITPSNRHLHTPSKQNFFGSRSIAVHIYFQISPCELSGYTKKRGGQIHKFFQ